MSNRIIRIPQPGALNSFVQPTHSGMPPLLLTRVMPYSACFGGVALLCLIESTPVIQRQSNLADVHWYIHADRQFTLCCFWTDDISAQFLRVKLTSRFQDRVEDPDRLACHSNLSLHAAKRIPRSVSVIHKHL